MHELPREVLRIDLHLFSFKTPTPEGSGSYE